ncbi:MAG: hypothetical protein AAGC88_02870 [Bacteroidota bacterium]
MIFNQYAYAERLNDKSHGTSVDLNGTKEKHTGEYDGNQKKYHGE